jgi:carboxypeptidase Taq
MATKATEAFIDPRIGELIEVLLQQEELGVYWRRLLGRLSISYQRAKAVPLDLVQEWNEAVSEAKRYWLEAKRKSDFSIFLPHLKRILDLLNLRAQAWGYEGHPYNAITQDFEPGMTVAEVERILLPLRDPLVEFVGRLRDSTPPDASCLTGDFPVADQERLSKAILQQVGFDFNAGRIDAIPGHPMTIWIGAKDTRITTRFSRSDLGGGLFASIHEGGHSIYNQGADPVFDRLYTDTGVVSMAIHESQSRMYENLIGRGMPFWRFFFPQLQMLFLSFNQVTLDDFWGAINVVKPSLIRIHADEVTYLLHILLRFELELAMLNGDLQPDDLPEAWNEKMEKYLGIRPENDAVGCLQDVHWSQGYVGYFPSYALGNLLAAQLWEVMAREIPDLEERISRGDFTTLLQWLREKVHRWGYSYTLPELAQEVTGRPLDSSAWLGYITDKFGQIYHL